MVRSINDRFTATMTNNVRWQDAPSCSADDRCARKWSHGCLQSAVFQTTPELRVSDASVPS